MAISGVPLGGCRGRKRRIRVVVWMRAPRRSTQGVVGLFGGVQPAQAGVEGGVQTDGCRGGGAHGREPFFRVDVSNSGRLVARSPAAWVNTWTSRSRTDCSAVEASAPAMAWKLRVAVILVWWPSPPMTARTRSTSGVPVVMKHPTGGALPDGHGHGVDLDAGRVASPSVTGGASTVQETVCSPSAPCPLTGRASRAPCRNTQ